MKNFKTFIIGIASLVLVLVVFTTVLVAQNPTPSKLAAPAETGQVTEDYPIVWNVYEGTDVSKTVVTLTFRDARSGAKIYPTVSAEESTNGSLIATQTISMVDYKQNKGIKVSVPDGELNFVFTQYDYKPMSLPLTIKGQGTLEYNVNLTPLTPDPRFSFGTVERLTKENLAGIVGTLIDADTGEPVTSGSVSTGDGKHTSTLDLTGYFFLEIPKEDTYKGVLQQDVDYITLVFKAKGYQTRIMKHVAVYLGVVGVMEGTRITKGTGVQEVDLPEIGATSKYKGEHPEEPSPGPQSKLNSSDQVVGDTTAFSLGNSKLLTPGSFPWNNCIPQAITVGFANSSFDPCCGSGCSFIVAFDINEYLRRVLPSEWLPAWQNYANIQQAYIAGVVAARSYSMYKMFFNPSSSSYHTCSSACCQVCGTVTYSSINAAVAANQNTVLTFNGQVANAEFSSENNNLTPECFGGSQTGCGCGNGKSGGVNPTGGCAPVSQCIDDIVGTGKKMFGHGHGMSQYGSARWATGLNISGPCTTANGQQIYGLHDWSWIVSHYYPNFTQSSLSSCGLDCVNLSNISCGTYTGQSTVGLGNNVMTYGTNITWNESGPEKVYKVVTNQTTNLSVTLSNVSYATGNQLNVFILKSPSNLCGSLQPLWNCVGTSSGLTATYNNAPASTYFIVVDGLRTLVNGSYVGSSGSYTINVSCNGIGQPNLTDYGSFGSNSGRTIYLTAKVVNNGTANAGPFITKFWLSTDTYLENGNDYPLAYINYSYGLAYGYYSTTSGTVTAPSNAPAGYYYILEKIDYVSGNPNGAVVESNEADNAWYLGPPFYLPPTFTGGADDRSVHVVGIVEVPVGDENTAPVNLEDVQDVLNMPVQITDLAQFTQGEPLLQPVQTTCTATVSGFEISASNVAENSSYVLANSSGQTICQGKATEGTISCQVNTTGVYFLSITDGEGNRCSQKVLVNQ